MIRINGYPIDCATEERLSYKATATKFPVEKGAALTDHIIVELPVLELDCLVSDTPTGEIAADATRTSLGGDVLPSRDAYDFLTGLHQAQGKSGGGPVTVECTYGKFANMAITALSPTRDVRSLKAFRFSVTFEQIEIAETNRVSIKTATPGSGTKKKLGNQPVTKINGQTVEKVIYVITFPVDKREFATKGYGKPVATNVTVKKNSYGVDIPIPPTDCYKVLPGRERNAEGYLTPVKGGGNADRPLTNNARFDRDAGVYEFHEFAALYNAETDSRRDLEGRDVTTTPAPKVDSKQPGKGPVKRGWWNEKEAR